MVSEGGGITDGSGNESTENTESRVGRADPSLRRRGFLRLGTAAAAATGLPAVVGTASAAGGVRLMEDPSPMNLSVGGGNRYGRTVRLRDADFNVWTRGMLLDALDDAGRGDVIHVPQDAAIDLTGESDLSIDDGVTLASGRGREHDAPGGVIYTDDYDTLFKVYSDDVRVTGLRLRGPRFGYYDPGNYSAHESQGLWLLGENCEVDNCQIFGWSVAGVSVGSRNRPYRAHVHHNSIHDNAMEGYGYGVNLYNGHSLIEHNYFDMNRHSICGFGFETNGYEARRNLVGPKTASHAFDMHGLQESTSATSNVAGGNVHVHHNTFRFTEDVLGRPQEAVTIRGVPAGRVLMEKNWFAHPEKPDGVDVSRNGQAYRQNNIDGDGWKNVYVKANHFGRHLACRGVGHPRPRAERPAWAVDLDGKQRARSGVRIRYENGFGQRLRVTDVTIKPESSRIERLADGSWDEGRWKSEVYVEADVRNGTTDVGGGVSLPGSIDLDSDGHSGSPDIQPILSGRSRGVFFLRDFLDRRGRPVDMTGERVTVKIDCKLDDGSSCHDEFDVVPKAG